ncbi:MAG: aromatic ring-hydroxylating dioxygenase subunit alpha [Sphingomonadales bacterium]|nr:MAG: aromatic ring-hydroxylating dioxygenase subunit alpha [Sphingomonadales bacterium]TNF06402.1 MAG: aromatic ring-hydroxylating dioxygenase subunit alpha [Sphingomonadales bacterium]
MMSEAESIHNMAGKAVSGRLPEPPAFMADATCLPSSAYTDQEFFDREIQHCFREGWISIGTVHQLGSSNEVLPVEFAGEPLLVTKDKQGEVRVFYNICRHRGVKLVSGDSAAKCGPGILSCPYHKWAYKLDGTLAITPYWDGTNGSRPEEAMRDKLGLIPVRSAVWSDLIFVNLSGDAEPFESFIQPLEARWKSFDRSLMRMTNTSSYEVAANWKLACENFLDTYHVPWVHRQLGAPDMMFRDLDYTYLSKDIFGFIMPHFDRVREEMDMVPDMFPEREDRFDYALDLIYIFPNTLLMITPSWFQSISLSPLAPGKTRELLAGFVVGEVMMTEEWREFRDEFDAVLDQVNVQDIGILELLQEGRKTGRAGEGQYAPYWDHLCEYLSQRVREKLTA